MRAPASLLHPSAAASPSGEISSLRPSPPPLSTEQQQALSVDSDMVVILASLLCALVCILGLALVSRRGACRRARRGATSADPPPKGLKREAIDALPTVSFGTTFAASSAECVICLAEFADGEYLRVLPRCGHGFHVGCVDAWLRTRATCPSCRARIAAQPAPAVVVPGRCGEVAPGGGGINDDTFLP